MDGLQHIHYDVNLMDGYGKQNYIDDHDVDLVDVIKYVDNAFR